MIRFAYQTQSTKFNPYAPGIKTTGKIMRERREGSSFRTLLTAVCKLHNLIPLWRCLSSQMPPANMQENARTQPGELFRDAIGSMLSGV